MGEIALIRRVVMGEMSVSAILQNGSATFDFGGDKPCAIASMKSAYAVPRLGKSKSEANAEDGVQCAWGQTLVLGDRPLCFHGYDS